MSGWHRTIIRSIYGVSVAVFGFALAVIVLEILTILWRNDSFSRNALFCQKKNQHYLQNYYTYDKSENSNREPVVSSNNGMLRFDVKS